VGNWRQNDATIRTTTADRAHRMQWGPAIADPKILLGFAAWCDTDAPVCPPTLGDADADGDGDGQGQGAPTYLRDRADLSSETEPVVRLT
jgi:hypothetical protein